MRIKNHTLVPPGGFAYMEPATGVTRDGQSLQATIQLVIEHRQSNNLPRQSAAEVSEDVSLQICQRSPAGYCYGDLSVVQEQDINREQLMSGIRALFEWITALATGEDPFVDQAEADRRAGICARCFLNNSKKGCSGCAFGERLRGTIGLTIGDRTTPRDPVLNACRICGCLNRVTVWFRGDILRRLTSDDMQRKYASVPGCWRGNL